MDALQENRSIKRLTWKQLSGYAEDVQNMWKDVEVKGFHRGYLYFF